MIAFLVFLLLISAVAAGIVAAFALPQLRAGAPILTDKGDRLARRAGNRLQPFQEAMWPRLQTVGRPVARVVGAVGEMARPATRPLVEAVRPRVAPLAQAISRAVEEGSAPTVYRPGAAAPQGALPGGAGTSAVADPSPSVARPDAFAALRLRTPYGTESKRSAA